MMKINPKASAGHGQAASRHRHRHRPRLRPERVRRSRRVVVPALMALGTLAAACSPSPSHRQSQPATALGGSFAAGRAPSATTNPSGAPTSSGPTTPTTPTTTAPAAPATTPTSTPSPRTTTTAAPASATSPAPAFTSSVAPVSGSDLGGSWRADCPVGPDQLRMLQLGYWGFDNLPHVGAMVVSASVTSDVVAIFGRLFAEHFPIHSMQTIDVFQGSDPASMAADNTSGFNCRYAVPPGNPPQWSAHAYGEAIDVNTVENPYIEGGTVMPAAGAAYVDRSTYRTGMATAGGQLVDAFASVGWQWGGRWSTPDYQHFSKTGA